MKKNVFILMLCMLSIGTVFAQEKTVVNDSVTQLTKAQKKAIEKRNNEITDSINHLVAVEALKKGYYVLMADRIIMKSRSYMNPAPNTNFLLVQGEEAVIQISSNSARPGLNGLGGITVEGKITSMRGGEVDKKGKITYDFSVSGAGVSAQVSVTLYKEDNQAMAIISSNFDSGTITVYGKVVPYEKTDFRKAIKGSTFP